MTGWTRTEAIGADVVNLLVAEPLRDGIRQRMMRLFAELSDTPLGIRFEATLMHRDGDEIPGRGLEHGAPARRAHQSSTISSRTSPRSALAEEQLIQAQKMEAVGQLTGGIAHEFNNMLTVITGTIEILADAVKDNPQLATITKLISEAADRGAALTSSLLSFARKQALQPAEIDVNELLEEVAKLLLATFDKKIEIVTRLDGNVWLAFADRGQLSAALLNLAINARDAMLDGGTLTLTTRNVVFGVREAVAVGAGYAGDYVEIESPTPARAFRKPFSNASSIPSSRPRMSARAPGSGSAWCSVSSSSPAAASRSLREEGRGTIFTIYLPKAETQHAPPRPAMTSARWWAARRPSFASRTTATSANMSPSSSKASATRSSPPPMRPKRSPSRPKARRSICFSPTS